MLTLALDTTTRAGSVAVVRDTTVLAVVHGDETRTHGERLPAEFERALQEARVAAGELQLLAVASGPGAFTGLRIGLAAIQGLAMVLDLPVVAVSALDALALTAVSSSDADLDLRPRPTAIAAWMDAARGEVFAAHYRPGDDWFGRSRASVPEPVSAPIVGPPEFVLAAMPPAPGTIFIGDGASRYRSQILESTDASRRVVVAAPALAPFIARIGMARAARGEAGPPHALQPLYVRRSDAELERQRRGARP